MDELSFDAKTGELGCNTCVFPVLFSSYEDKGWKDSGFIEVPDSNFAFKIMSNFGYGNSSYLKCGMKYNEQLLVDSEKWCETTRLLTYWNEQPTPEYWGYLLKHICRAYKMRNVWNYNNILDAATKLNGYLLNPELLEVRAYRWSERVSCYTPQLKNVHLISKCDELIKKIKELKFEDFDNIRQVTDEVCNKAISLIFKTYNSIINESSNNTNIRISHLKKITDSFDTIYNFLRDKERLNLLFLNNIINNN